MFTIRQDPDGLRAPDLVKRRFTADRPNALWVTDLTYVPTRTGMAYVCFIMDAFSRRIVGWTVAAHMRTDMVLDAVEMARRSRGGRRLVGLITHSDAGWFNHDRLHGHCGDIPPAEYEANWAHAQSSGNGGADHAVPVAGS